MQTALGCIFVFSLWVLPFILAKLKWSSAAIGYTTACICTFIALITGGSIESGEIRIPSLPILLLEWASGTLISGTILWGIVALVRRIFSRSKSEEPPQAK